MATPSPGNSITVRVVSPSGAQATGQLTAAIAAAGGALTALDVVESHHDQLVIDVTCNTTDDEHAKAITAVLARLPGFEVRKVSDRTFLMHLGGKIGVDTEGVPATRDDLSRAYTPGVARVCLAIAENPEDARRLTIKRNTVAVVSDGSAVLGLGNIGPAAAMPVMEGKAALFKRFADVDAWPVCLDTQDTDEIIDTVAPSPRRTAASTSRTSPRHAASRSRHGCARSSTSRFSMMISTAPLSWCSPPCATRCGSSDKSLPDVRIVISGVGAAGSAITGCCSGPRGQADCRQRPPRCAESCRPFVEHDVGLVASTTNPTDHRVAEGRARGCRRVHRRVGPEPVDGEDIATWTPDAIVFALANPVPEVDPVGRSASTRNRGHRPERFPEPDQ